MQFNLGNENCDVLKKCVETIWKDFNSVEDKTQNHALFVQRAWAILLAVVLINISIYVFRWMQYKTEQECDRGLISASDFTIMIGRLPKGDYTEHDIVEIINKYIQLSDNEKMKGGIIKKIDLSYELTDYFEAKYFIKEIEKKLREKNKDLDFNLLENQKNVTKKFVANFEIENNFDAIKLKGQTNGVVFVTFKNQLSNVQSNLIFFLFISKNLIFLIIFSFFIKENFNALVLFNIFNFK